MTDSSLFVFRERSRLAACPIRWNHSLASLLTFLFAQTLSADPVTIVEEIQANLARALELRTIRANEVSNWQQLKPQLDSMIGLGIVDNEILAEQISELEIVVTDYTERLHRAEMEIEDSEALLELIEIRFASLNDKLEQMVLELPERLREKGKYLLEQTRERTSFEDAISIRRGIEVYLEFITEVVAFDRETRAYSEIRALPDGKNAEFTVIHVGLGATFFVSEELGKAGRIRMKEGEWVWEENADMFKRLVLVKHILEGKADPQFVGMPFALKQQSEL